MTSYDVDVYDGWDDDNVIGFSQEFTQFAKAEEYAQAQAEKYKNADVTLLTLDDDGAVVAETDYSFYE